MRLLSHSIATVALPALLASAACDSTPRGRDASAGGQKVSEVAVRFEVAGDAAPSVSLLAYRASVSGAGTDDILSVVDPLTAAAPEGFCSFRDVAGAARALGAAGGRVELEALPGWHLDLGPGRGALTASPRVFPDIAAVVGGVVAEVGPVDLLGLNGRTAGADNGAVSELGVALRWPTDLALLDAGGGRIALAPPQPVRLIGPAGNVLPANSAISVGASATAAGDLVFGLGGDGAGAPTAAGFAPAFLELRPFGATWALACPAVSRDKVVVPAVEVARLAGLRVPVSVEAVSRETRSVATGAASVRLTVEVRASSVVELRP